MSVLIKGSAIAGILNLNKPSGLTSHDVVARIRKLTGIRRVGHTGTLDPMATGVLVVCVGQATRLIEYMGSARKKYRAVVRFGQTTDTLDIEGQILEQRDTGSNNPRRSSRQPKGKAGLFINSLEPVSRSSWKRDR